MQNFAVNAAWTPISGAASEQSRSSSMENAPYCEITNRILVVSPRPALLRSLVAELATICYDVLLLHHFDDPLLGIMQGNIVILDRTDPIAMENRLDGRTLPQGFQSSPVLSLLDTAPDESSNEQNWIVWPCPIDDVIAKIKELAAVYEVASEDTQVFSFKDLTIDIGRMLVSRANTRIDLTKTEYDLLRLLYTAQGQVMSREKLMTGIWGEPYFGGSNSVDVHIKSLRQKLGDDPKQPRYIATVRGAGYRLADS